MRWVFPADRLDRLERRAQAGVRVQLAARVRALVAAPGDPAPWWDGAEDAFLRIVGRVYADAVKAISAEFGVVVPVEPLVSDQGLRAAVAAVRAQMSATDVGLLEAAVRDSVAAGESVPETARALRAGPYSADRVRALVAGRTLTQAAVGLASQDAMLTVGAELGVVAKEWVATSDSRTRDRHRVLDGRVVPTSGEFAAGLRFPGDPGARAEDAINCRCTLAWLDQAEVDAIAGDRVQAPAPVADEPKVRSRAAQRMAESRALDRERWRVESANVVQASKRYGVAPDQVVAGRPVLSDARRAAGLEALEVQRAALGEMDFLFGGTRLRTPPRVGARSGGGRRLRGGEWDWLEQVSVDERKRLSTSWFGGESAPDQLAEEMSRRLGREVSVDEAMGKWLELNRRAEAAGSIAQGKLPVQRRYSGQVVVDDLAPRASADRVSVEVLFGDDVDAAAQLVAADQRVMVDDALQYLGDAATNPVHGPAPYRMGFLSWEAEVRDLEYLAENRLASPVELERLRELVPVYLDEPGLDFELLYARIVVTARRAGEEVPSYAVIPW